MKKFIAILFSFITIFLLFSLFFIQIHFIKLTIEQIIFFIITPLKGVDKSVYIEVFIYLIAPTLLLSIIVGLFIRYKKNLDLDVVLICCFTFSGIILYEINKDLKITDYLGYISKTSNVYEKFYINPETAIINHEGKDYQNLILIYMESMEANFARTEKDNQNLIPFLDDIAKKNVSFAHFEEGYAQNWTQGALFSSMSGIPINYLSSDFSWSNYVSALITSFGKNIYTLPQILKKYGYTNILVQGSDISFSGLDTFLFSHGYLKENIYDLNYIKNENPNIKDLKYWWGIQDKDTYKVFKEKIETLAKTKKPFFATMFTIDTHRGVFPKSPDTPFNDKAKNTIYQASILVKDFIDWEQSQDFAKNTTIVIIGDHLRMYDEHGKFINEYKENERRIYNVFINSKILPKSTERHFTQMDMFPSLLECIGFRVKDGKLGLGRSLFSENKTLSEEFGTENLNHQLIKRNKLYEKLWKE